MLEITKMLTLSTAHIKPQTGELLTEEAAESKMGLTVYNKGEGPETCGWFIFLSRDFENSYRKAADNENIPRELYRCIALALDAGCEVLCLDSDGPVMSYLTQYIWDD